MARSNSGAEASGHVAVGAPGDAADAGDGREVVRPADGDGEAPALDPGLESRVFGRVVRREPPGGVLGPSGDASVPRPLGEARRELRGDAREGRGARTGAHEETGMTREANPDPEALLRQIGVTSLGREEAGSRGPAQTVLGTRAVERPHGGEPRGVAPATGQGSGTRAPAEPWGGAAADGTEPGTRGHASRRESDGMAGAAGRGSQAEPSGRPPGPGGAPRPGGRAGMGKSQVIGMRGCLGSLLATVVVGGLLVGGARRLLRHREGSTGSPEPRGAASTGRPLAEAATAVACAPGPLPRGLQIPAAGQLGAVVEGRMRLPQDPGLLRRMHAVSRALPDGGRVDVFAPGGARIAVRYAPRSLALVSVSAAFAEPPTLCQALQLVGGLPAPVRVEVRESGHVLHDAALGGGSPVPWGGSVRIKGSAKRVQVLQLEPRGSSGRP